MFNFIKNLSIALASCLLASFFLPWSRYMINISGFDFVLGNFQVIVPGSVRFTIFFIPMAALLLLYLGISNYGRNLFWGKGVVFAIPFIAIFLASVITKYKAGPTMKMSEYLDTTFIWGLGIWITLICSLLLLIIGLAAPRMNIFSIGIPEEDITIEDESAV